LIINKKKEEDLKMKNEELNVTAVVLSNDQVQDHNEVVVDEQVKMPEEVNKEVEFKEKIKDEDPTKDGMIV
jgi:hypothetical protein